VRATTRRATSIARFVGHDLQQPRAERGIGPEAIERGVGLDECILGDVLRIGGVARDQVRDAEGNVLIASDKLSERPAVTPPRLLDEPGIF
jgi:hypothetical protein